MNLRNYVNKKCGEDFMERDFGKEIDSLKKELSEIKKLLTKETTADGKAEHIEKMPKMHPDPNIMAILDRLENSCGVHGETGLITYLGVFSSGGRQSTWVKNGINTNVLLELISNKTAEKVLSCIGNSDRLNILLAILKKPMTVTELIEDCNFRSSGQAYHHMKPLLAADLITEDNINYSKGTYIIQPHKVQGIIMLLAGICDMVDETYTKGNWETSE